MQIKCDISLKEKEIPNKKLKIFPDDEEKDAYPNASKTTFYKNYFLAMRKQVMISVEQRLEQIESHAAIFTFFG